MDTATGRLTNLSQAEQERQQRAEKLPDENTCLQAMLEAHSRLRELGWEDAVYCPKDGSLFLVIEAGSTGIHECQYLGEWPGGGFFVAEGGDMWPSRPILWKAIEVE